jgi:hypothetical protein
MWEKREMETRSRPQGKRPLKAYVCEDDTQMDLTIKAQGVRVPAGFVRRSSGKI